MSSDKVKEAAFELSKLGCFGYSGWFGLSSCTKRLRRRLEAILRKRQGGYVIEELIDEVIKAIIDSWASTPRTEDYEDSVREEVKVVLTYYFGLT